jgi:hypothetical protein
MTAIAMPSSPPAAVTGRRSRAPVPVQQLLDRLQQVVHVGSSLYALLKRVVLLVLQRMAGAFNVKLDQRGLDEAGGRGEAAFEADATGAPVAAAVQEAATAATLELNAWVQEIVNKPKDHWVEHFATSPEAAPAFLAHALSQLGSAIAQGKTVHDDAQQRLAAGVAEHAARIGVSESAVRALLADGKGLPEGLVQSDASLKDLAVLAEQAESAAQQVLRLKLSFCDHCVAAMQVDAAALGAIARSKADALGDPQLWAAVELALASRPSHEANFSVKQGQSPLNLSAGEEPLTSAVSRAPRQSRSQRFGRSIVDDDIQPPVHDGDDEPEEAGRGPRQR